MKDQLTDAADALRRTLRGWLLTPEERSVAEMIRTNRENIWRLEETVLPLEEALSRAEPIGDAGDVDDASIVVLRGDNVQLTDSELGEGLSVIGEGATIVGCVIHPGEEPGTVGLGGRAPGNKR